MEEKEKKSDYEITKEKVKNAYAAASIEQREFVINNIANVYRYSKDRRNQTRVIAESLWLMDPPLSKVEIGRKLGISGTSVGSNEKIIVKALSTRLGLLSHKQSE